MYRKRNVAYVLVIWSILNSQLVNARNNLTHGFNCTPRNWNLDLPALRRLFSGLFFVRIFPNVVDIVRIGLKDCCQRNGDINCQHVNLDNSLKDFVNVCGS